MPICPERKVVLIGDSGERDPETYATIRKESGEWMTKILIRDVKGDARARLDRVTIILERR